MKLETLPINILKTHERVRWLYVLQLIWKMLNTGIFTHPILVDKETKVILDGHHRYHACRILKCRIIPCYTTDYLHDSSIKVTGWKTNFKVNKNIVLAHGLSGKLMPHKTSRHHTPVLATVAIPLKKLH